MSNTQQVQLSLVEQQMLKAFQEAAPEQQAELRRLAQDKPIGELTSILQARYPSYASFITEERVAHVMAVYQDTTGSSTAPSTEQPVPSAPGPGFLKRLRDRVQGSLRDWGRGGPRSFTEFQADERRRTERAARRAEKQQARHAEPQPHTTNADGLPLTTSDMSQAQLRARRIRRVEAAKVARPLHESVMLFFLKCWLLCGPPAFVGLTVFEVSYIFQQLLPPGDSGDKIIFFGALFVDVAMMFTTFGLAIKRRDLAEKREVQGSVTKREEAEVWFGTALWLVFAAINIIGQSAFLLRIVQSSAHPGNLTLIYLFIGARVTGFILGDACTAFFLAKVDSSALKLIARSEREKGMIYADIADAEGKRQIAEAEAEARILLIQLEVQQKQEDAKFLAAIKRKAFASALGETPPAPSEPPRSRVYRGTT